MLTRGLRVMWAERGEPGPDAFRGEGAGHGHIPRRGRADMGHLQTARGRWGELDPDRTGLVDTYRTAGNRYFTNREAKAANPDSTPGGQPSRGLPTVGTSTPTTDRRPAQSGAKLEAPVRGLPLAARNCQPS
jgi:hypothetical protein